MGWTGIPSRVRLPKEARNEERLALYFIVQTDTADDERIYNLLHGAESELAAEISSRVSAILGSLFRVERVEVRRGSVEMWVVVAGGFTLISQYKDFVRSLELLHSQIANLIRDFLARQNIYVTIAGGWTPVSGIRGRRFGFGLSSFRITPDFVLLLLVLYLIVSHAVLLSVFIWRTAHPIAYPLVRGELRAELRAATNAYECIERTEKQVPNFRASGTHAEVDYVLLHDAHKIYASCDSTEVSNLDSNARCGLRPLRIYECIVQPDTIEKGTFPLSDLKCKDGDGHSAYLYVSKKE